jgi:hypothetical protein
MRHEPRLRRRAARRRLPAHPIVEPFQAVPLTVAGVTLVAARRSRVTLASSRVCDNHRMIVTIAIRILGPAPAEITGSIHGLLAGPA